MNSGLSFIKVISSCQKMVFSTTSTCFFSLLLFFLHLLLLQDLPSATVPQLQGILGCRVTLRNVDKKSWRVEVERGGDGYSFNKGWPQFYQQNSLKPNYVLLFTYKHENLFDFKVFGHNACEKEGVGCPEIRMEEEAEEVEEVTVKEEEEEDEDEDEDEDDEDYVVDELEYEEEEPVCISKNRSKSCRLKRDLCSNHAKAPIGRVREEEIEIVNEEGSEDSSESDEIEMVMEEEEEEARKKHKSRSPFSSPIERVREEEIKIEVEEEDGESAKSDKYDGIEEDEETENKSKAKHKYSTASSSHTHKKRDYYGYDIFKSGLITQPKNPYFVSRSRHSRKNALYIPKDAILCLNLKIPLILFLVDESGRKWEAKIKKWKDGRVWCTSGWKRMCRANNIRVDDTCICELVQEGRNRLSMLVRVVDVVDAAARK